MHFLDFFQLQKFCALLHENVEALIVSFHKANEKHKTDTMRDLQQNQEEAFEKMSEQLKTQEHCWHKEKKFLEQQYANLLAEAQARAQDCEGSAQRNRICYNTQKEPSSLLQHCSTAAGALFPLYSRLCAMSSQRNLSGDRSILQTLPTNPENSQDETRLRQRRTRELVYTFRRSVVAVLAANRFRLLARYSCSLFVWTSSSRASIGIQVCVGESREKFSFTGFEEEGVDCIEALDWLTSSNLYTAVIESISELQEVLNRPDPNSWLSGHSLVSAARNSFARLMDSLTTMMETVQVNQCRCIVFLERDSLVQRLACGLLRVTTQALEAGSYDRQPSTVAILQQRVFELSRRLHTAEGECRTLNLQLSEFKWTFNEMKKDAEKAHRLQEELHWNKALLHPRTTIHQISTCLLVLLNTCWVPKT
uniref:CC171 protein n=1 Tax=Malurus cyaneus samueli TaxID=2593467 RepID=A0A8C5UH38_9PASS